MLYLSCAKYASNKKNRLLGSNTSFYCECRPAPADRFYTVIWACALLCAKCMLPEEINNRPLGQTMVVAITENHYRYLKDSTINTFCIIHLR